MALSDRTKKITGIISMKDVDYKTIRALLEPYLAANTFDYAFIYHDCDHLEDGQVKTPHIHYCGNWKTVKRLSTVLGEISSVCGIVPTAITISKYESFSGCLQYLIHKNNPEKFQYKQKDIVTNIPAPEMDAFMAEDNKLDMDSLIKLVMSSPDRLSIMRSLGLTRYRMYRNMINDIENSLKGRKV